MLLLVMMIYCFWCKLNKISPLVEYWLCWVEIDWWKQNDWQLKWLWLLKVVSNRFDQMNRSFLILILQLLIPLMLDNVWRDIWSEWQAMSWPILTLLIRFQNVETYYTRRSCFFTPSPWLVQRPLHFLFSSFVIQHLNSLFRINDSWCIVDDCDWWMTLNMIHPNTACYT